MSTIDPTARIAETAVIGKDTVIAAAAGLTATARRLLSAGRGAALPPPEPALPRPEPRVD